MNYFLKFAFALVVGGRLVALGVEPVQIIDKSVVEIFANDRQAIARRIYPTRSDSLGVRLFSLGGVAKFKTVKAWNMMPANPY